MVAQLTFRSASRTHRGLVRETNEDALLALDGQGLWAVSDGMGGHAAGEIASGLVIDHLRALERELPERGLEVRARETLAEVNSHICSCNETAVPPTNMGATVAVLGIEGLRYFCLWSGDSRIYRVRGGSITQLSRDHLLVQTLIETGMLSEADVPRHPQRHVITHAVGVSRNLWLESCDGNTCESDVFVLLTDGVSNLCSTAEIAEIVRPASLEESVEALSELCLSRGAPDNFSIVLVTSRCA